MDPDSAFEVSRGVAVVPHSILRVHGADGTETLDQLAVEEPLEIRLGGLAFTVTMRTPGADEDLVAGLLHTEGLIRGADNLDVIARYRGTDGETDPGNVINVLLKGDVQVARERLRRSLVVSSACGVCGKVTIDSIKTACPPVVSDAAVPAGLFPRLLDSMAAAQSTFERTGGLHAAGLFDTDGILVVLREDIGRHNAVDKVIGWALRGGRLPLAGCVLLVSGRASFELTQKALMAGLPVLAAVSAPSSLAAELAAESGMTLVGFLRGSSMNVYAGPDRLTG